MSVRIVLCNFRGLNDHAPPRASLTLPLHAVPIRCIPILPGFEVRRIAVDRTIGRNAEREAVDLISGSIGTYRFVDQQCTVREVSCRTTVIAQARKGVRLEKFGHLPCGLFSGFLIQTWIHQRIPISGVSCLRS